MARLRKLLLPFGWIYGGITASRNFLYRKNLLKSIAYPFPVICVGNLNTGGTGKSPMIEFLLKTLSASYKVATLSRGYKRKTKGFILLSGKESAEEVGDEPLQFKLKFSDVLIAVDADRRNGISKLAQKGAEVILLDDAFQHRKVSAGFNILLTAYHDLFVDDLMLPAGNLREPSKGFKRADVIVVTKCPDSLETAEIEKLKRKLPIEEHQKLFFSYISYASEILGAMGSQPIKSLKSKKITLVTGIANPNPLVNFLKSKNLNFEHLKFPDHHNFTEKELQVLQQKQLVLTTEKDYMRLKDKINREKLQYLPIQTGFLKDEEEFKTIVRNYVMSDSY